MKIIVLTLTLSFFALHATGQQAQPDSYRYGHRFDIAVSGGDARFSSALSWSHYHKIGKKNKLQVGYGLRFTSFVAANQYYTTAPAKFTSPVQNLGTIFSETIDANIDTITTATTVTNSFNLGIYLQYRFNEKFEVGFNIDAIGFSFGPGKSYNVIASEFDAGQAPVQSAEPTRFNLLLTSDNDIGSLNSELYVRYWFTQRWGARLGYTFLFSEVTTNEKLSFDNSRIVNDRYRYKAGMVMVAVSLKPFLKK